jgi:cytidylate kinase
LPVITISRQFGAAGVPIGRELAERFGAEFLDRQIVAEAALRSGVPEDELESYDERLPSLWQRVASVLASSSPEVAMPLSPYVEDMSQLSTHDRLVAVTSSVIEEAAARGNAVIVGRGAAFILGRRSGMLHVHLHASLDARIRYLMSRVEETPVDARSQAQPDVLPDERSLRGLCASVDAARADYIRRLFGVDWLDATHYDLAVDTGRLGVARTVDLIEGVVRSGTEAEVSSQE